MLREFINLIFTAITTIEMDKYKVHVFSSHGLDSFGAECVAHDIEKYLESKGIKYNRKQEIDSYFTDIKYWFTIDRKKCYIAIQYKNK